MEYSRFFPSINNDRTYSASDVNQYLYVMLEKQEGVLQGVDGQLVLSNSGSLSVSVATGAATKGGALYINDAAITLPLSSVSSGAKRYDVIVIRNSATLRSMNATVIQGVEGSNPSVPSYNTTTDVLLGNILIDNSTGSYVYTVTDARQMRPFVYTSSNAIATLTHGMAEKSSLNPLDEIGVLDSGGNFALTKITAQNLLNWAAVNLPLATTQSQGSVVLATTGIQDATKVPKATGSEIAALLTAGGFTLAPAVGQASLENIADGATRKAVTATEKTTVTALDTEVSGTSALGAWSPPRVAELDPDRFHLERISGGRASIRYSASGRVPIEVVWVEAFSCSEVSPDYCRARANSTAYVIGQLLMANGQLYEVTTAGTTGSAAPVYPTTVGQSVADGTATITLVQNSYSDLYPAFSVAGTKKGGQWYSRFLCDIVSGKPRSIAGQLPFTGATIDSIRTYAAAFGNGASPMTYWDYEALALDAFRKGIVPVGNTYYGRSHKTAESVYGGIRGDLYKPGDTAGGNPYTRGGSAGQIWTHDRSMWGVHDAVGNCYKWVDGVKYMDGQLFVHAYDNDPALLTLAGEDSWIATGIYIDGTVAGDDSGGDNIGYPRFTSSVVNYTASVTPPRDAATIKADARDLDYLYRSTYGTVDVMSSIDAIDAAKRLLAFRLQILPKIRSAGLAPFATQEGAMYARNNGERFAVRSGHYIRTSLAGPRFVYAHARRSYGFAFSLVFKS